jgi:hypothetical protein
MPSIGASVGSGGVNRSADVMVVQRLLNEHRRALAPLPALRIDGDAGPKTLAAIRAFQTRVLRLARPDSRVDPAGRTLEALNGSPSTAPRFQYVTGPQEPLADIARPYLGATEAPGNRMGTDPRMREIFESDRYAPEGRTDGYAWCCAFVSMCVQKLIARSPFYASVTPPYTPSVSHFRTQWAPSQNCLIFPPGDPAEAPHTGDIVVFTFSHIGIVESVQPSSVTTLEGNTNEAGSREGTSVQRKHRPFAQVRSWIRLPLPARYDFSRQMCLA